MKCEISVKKKKKKPNTLSESPTGHSTLEDACIAKTHYSDIVPLHRRIKKGKRHWRNPHTGFLILSSSCDRGPLSLLLSPTYKKHVQCSYSGKPLRNSEPKVLNWGEWGQLPRHTCTSGRTKFQTPKRKAGVRYTPHCSHQQLRHTASHPYWIRKVGTLSKSKFPDACQGKDLQASLSKHSNFRPAKLTLCFTDTNPVLQSHPHTKVAISNSFVWLVPFKGFFRRWHYKSSRSEILQRLKMAWLYLFSICISFYNKW